MQAAGIKQFESILWDVDGTLLDFFSAEKEAIKSLFLEFGLGECTDEMLSCYSKINKKYWEKLEQGEMTKPQILVQRFEEFFKVEGIEPSLGEGFNTAYQKRLGDTIIFCDNSKEIVASLQGKIRQYVVSNGTIVAQTKKLERSGFDKLMDGVFLSEQIGYEKPSKEFFDWVFQKIRPMDKNKVLIVGDSLTSDIAGGNRVGIKTCWYNPKALINDTSVKADYEIQNLGDILKLL
ncbi:YjjG family noncanonical pyrimidine nucleotidase [Lachnospiraceae bacterium 62-35]